MASVDYICDGSVFFWIYVEIIKQCLPTVRDHVDSLFRLRWVTPAERDHEEPDDLHNHPLIYDAYTSDAITSLQYP